MYEFLEEGESTNLDAQLQYVKNLVFIYFTITAVDFGCRWKVMAVVDWHRWLLYLKSMALAMKVVDYPSSDQPAEPLATRRIAATICVVVVVKLLGSGLVLLSYSGRSAATVVHSTGLELGHLGLVTGHNRVASVYQGSIGKRIVVMLVAGWVTGAAFVPCLN